MSIPKNLYVSGNTIDCSGFDGLYIYIEKDRVWRRREHMFLGIGICASDIRPSDDGGWILCRTDDHDMLAASDPRGQGDRVPHLGRWESGITVHTEEQPVMDLVRMLKAFLPLILLVLGSLTLVYYLSTWYYFSIPDEQRGAFVLAVTLLGTIFFGCLLI